MKNNLNLTNIKNIVDDKQFINHVEKYYIKNHVLYIKFYVDQHQRMFFIDKKLTLYKPKNSFFHLIILFLCILTLFLVKKSMESYL